MKNETKQCCIDSIELIKAKLIVIYGSIDKINMTSVCLKCDKRIKIK